MIIEKASLIGNWSLLSSTGNVSALDDNLILGINTIFSLNLLFLLVILHWSTFLLIFNTTILVLLQSSSPGSKFLNKITITNFIQTSLCQFFVYFYSLNSAQKLLRSPFEWCPKHLNMISIFQAIRQSIGNLYSTIYQITDISETTMILLHNSKFNLSRCYLVSDESFL